MADEITYEELLENRHSGGTAGHGRHQVGITELRPGEVYGPSKASSLYAAVRSLGLDRREYKVVQRGNRDCCYVVRLKPEDIK